MSALDFLYLSLAVGFLVLAFFISFAAFQLAKTLVSLRLVLEDIKDTTRDVSRLKNALKLGIFGLLATLIKKRR